MARPVEFEMDTVLQKAMDTFWEHGYSATSMSNLVEVTGLKPGSIYAAFGSKEGLFLSAIDKYGQRSVKRLQALIEQAD
ncbi:MAG: helix-turn-helix transcriptional regulator, partial [Gammaproteobacteria bacterium]|nr:helix-turn-helix transcriptional regulator [Gammaproteobacteria bacterium]